MGGMCTTAADASAVTQRAHGESATRPRLAGAAGDSGTLPVAAARVPALRAGTGTRFSPMVCFYMFSAFSHADIFLKHVVTRLCSLARVRSFAEVLYVSR